MSHLGFAAATACLLTCVSIATARAHPVANWTEAAAKVAMQEARVPGPPETRLRAQVALAAFEAANAVDGRYESYLGLPKAAGPASTEAAVARAAYDVLVAAHPGRAQELGDALELALSAVADRVARERGEAAGRAAAAAVLARPGFGPGEDPPYMPAAAPGRYIGTDLPAVPPKARLARPYFLDSAQGVAPGQPPSLGSKRYARDVEEVRRLGGKASMERSPAQTASAVFWARQDILAPLRDLTVASRRSLVENARTYAVVALAMDDASNAVTAAKLDHGLWRPVTAIRNAAADGNPGTTPDPAWEPLLRTPPHPEYPCGHCIMTATFASIVAAEFGEDVRIHIQDAAMPAASRTLTPRGMLKEASVSRILAGAHFRFSAEAGETMGRAIAARALASMKPLSTGDGR